MKSRYTYKNPAQEGKIKLVFYYDQTRTRVCGSFYNDDNKQGGSDERTIQRMRKRLITHPSESFKRYRGEWERAVFFDNRSPYKGGHQTILAMYRNQGGTAVEIPKEEWNGEMQGMEDHKTSIP